MDWPTIIIASIIGAIFVLIIACDLRNRKKGKHSCSCGGSCGSCGMNCHQNNENNKR